MVDIQQSIYRDPRRIVGTGRAGLARPATWKSATVLESRVSSAGRAPPYRDPRRIVGTGRAGLAGDVETPAALSKSQALSAGQGPPYTSHDPPTAVGASDGLRLAPRVGTPYLADAQQGVGGAFGVLEGQAVAGSQAPGGGGVRDMGHRRY